MQFNRIAEVHIVFFLLLLFRIRVHTYVSRLLSIGVFARFIWYECSEFVQMLRVCQMSRTWYVCLEVLGIFAVNRFSVWCNYRAKYANLARTVRCWCWLIVDLCSLCVMMDSFARKCTSRRSCVDCIFCRPFPSVLNSM